jgi:hypothetical protein
MLLLNSGGYFIYTELKVSTEPDIFLPFTFKELLNTIKIQVMDTTNLYQAKIER